MTYKYGKYNGQYDMKIWKRSVNYMIDCMFVLCFSYS